jgi:hypothetical protein
MPKYNLPIGLNNWVMFDNEQFTWKRCINKNYVRYLGFGGLKK